MRVYKERQPKKRMRKRMLIIALVIILLVVAVGCSKEKKRTLNFKNIL